MADVTYTGSINPQCHASHVGTSRECSTQLDLGNDVILSPPAKAISVNTDGDVDMILSGDETTNTVRKIIAGGIHKNIRIKKIIAATTDTGLGLHVYWD